MPKKDEKVQMCVDYGDLNRASLKDDFPLPHIDILVDNTEQHKVFPSWTDSQVTTKSKWRLRTWRKQPLSHSGELSAIR